MDTSLETYNTPFSVNRGIQSSWNGMLYPTAFKIISALWSTPTLVFDTEKSREEWFWTEEWQAGERKADEDIAQGRYSEVETVEELLVYLDGLEKEKEEEEG